MTILPIILYLLCSCVNIYNHKIQQDSIHHIITHISKVLLMPLLFLFYINNTEQISIIVIIALTFAWFGDLIIMLHHTLNDHDGKKNMTPLLLGLTFFLCGHMAYITLFVKSHLKLHPIAIMAFIIYALSGYFVYRYLLNNGLLKKDTKMVSNQTKKLLRRAIALYMFIILTMSYTAFLRFISINTFKATITFIGSLSFLLSDTSLSLKEFGQLNNVSEKLVMLTYTLAQALIVIGLT